MSDNSAANKRIAKNTLFLYIRIGICTLISLYTSRVVLNVLGVDDFGVYNVVCGFVSLFGVFNVCFSTCINRFYNFEIGQGREGGVKNVFNAALRIQAVLSLIIVVLIEAVGVWYLNNKMVIAPERLGIANVIFQFSVFSMVMTIMQAPYSAAVMSYEKMDYYAVVSIIDAFLNLGFVLLLKIIPLDKLLFYGIIKCSITLVTFLMYFFYCRVKFREIRFTRGFDKSYFKPMLSFSGWSLLDPVSYTARDQGTNMVLNAFFGTAVNAAQGIAYSVAAAVDSFAGSLSTSFRPQIIQSYAEGNYQRTKRLMYSMSRLNLILQLMIAIPVCFEIEQILRLWLGPECPGYAPIFTVLVISVKAINCLNSPISQVMTATGKIKVIKSVSAVIVCMTVPLAILLFKLGCAPWSIYAGLLGITIINQISCVIILAKTFTYITVQDYLNSIVWPTLLFLFISVLLPMLITVFLPKTLWRLLFNLPLSCLAVIAVGYFVLLDKEEKGMFKEIFGKFTKMLKR